MKGIFIILDGVSDLPHYQLNQKTPLEIAKTPNLDEIAKHSKLDYCFTVKENIAPQSSNAIVSLLGNDPLLASRGALEAQGANIYLKNGDLALRTNFATIDNLQNLNVLDRRAGRTLTTKEAKILAKALNEKIKLSHKFEFRSTVQHRGVLVIRGGFSDNVTNIDNGYGKGVVTSDFKDKLNFSHPVDDEDDSKYTSEILNSFVRQTFEVLEKHPVNLTRIKKGLCPANIILCRDAGNSPVKLKKPKGKWMFLGQMPLEIGIAKAMNISIYKIKPIKFKKLDAYSYLHKSLERTIKHAKKMLKKNQKKYDYFYIHFKETDTPGHDNLPLEKVKMIETLDKKFFSFLKEFIKKKNIKLILTADHTTACKLKNHTADPVPVLIYPSQKTNEKQRFTEENAKKGRKILGRKLLENNLLN